MEWVRDARHQAGGATPHSRVTAGRRGAWQRVDEWTTAAGVSESAALVRQATCAPESAEACWGVAVAALCLMV
jgi:hypothetical protein